MTQSVTKNLRFEIQNLSVTEEDLKLLFICTLGAVCAGGSAAFVGSLCLSLFRRCRKKPETDDIEHDPSLHSVPADGKHHRHRRSTLDNTAASGAYIHRSDTVQRSKHKQPWSESGEIVSSIESTRLLTVLR